MKKIDFNKHIWEGWTVLDFINDLEWHFNLKCDSIKTKEELKKWIAGEQPYYKKHIPEVYSYFLERWKIRKTNG